MQNEWLPLFPLGVVLFPRTPLPLHIFEDRYKEMVGDAIRDKTEFGVVQAGEKGIASTGCTAVVEEVLRTYPDGRLDIMTRGQRRFEILMLNEEKSYLRGAVQFFDDEENAPAPDDDLRNRALTGYQTARELEETEAPAEPQLGDPQLSFQLAQILTDLHFRQLLLGSRSEIERMRRLAEFFPDYVSRRQLVTRLRQVVPMNGHSSHLPSIGERE